VKSDKEGFRSLRKTVKRFAESLSHDRTEIAFDHR
jgi:hypothetical protein